MTTELRGTVEPYAQPVAQLSPSRDDDPCEHRDGYGSTIIFVQDRPQDGVCILCDAEFPALTVVR